jgi:hypothetical protein
MTLPAAVIRMTAATIRRTSGIRVPVAMRYQTAAARPDTIEFAGRVIS